MRMYYAATYQSINKNNTRFIELYKVKVNEGIMKVYFGENLNLEAV